MRNAIVNHIFELMHRNKKIFFLTGDMGINLIEKFEEKFPDRFLNVGIAEQNLIGVSAGLYNAGYLPFAYAISNFITQRCLEQIRNDIVLHNYPITLIGTSTGFDNAALGPTHHVVDDWGTLKGLPGLNIYCPNSLEYAKKIIPNIIKNKKPSYIRIPKTSFEDVITSKDYFYKKGKNKNNLIISYGGTARSCLEINKSNKVSCLLMNKLHPIDKNKILKIIKNYKNVLVVEDQMKLNNLYSSLCELLYNESKKPNLHQICPDKYELRVGNSQDYFYKEFKMDKNSILSKLKKIG